MSARLTNPSPIDSVPADRDLIRYLRGTFASVLDPRVMRQRGDVFLELLAREASETLGRLAPGEIQVEVRGPGGAEEGHGRITLLMADQPFIVDTFRLTLRRLGLREIFLLHAVLAVERSDDGCFVPVGEGPRTGPRQAYVYAEIGGLEDADERGRVLDSFRETFERTRNVVSDHGVMVEALRAHIDEFTVQDRNEETDAPSGIDAASFLEWLSDDNFVFFGYRYYRVSRDEVGWEVRLKPGSGLGYWRGPGRSRFDRPLRGEAIPAVIRSRLGDRRRIFFDKSRTPSTIHREGRLDSVTIKSFGPNGELRGFGRFVGLLTYKAIRSRGSEVPILRLRRDRILTALRVESGSHTHKAAIEAYDSLPIEFLFPFDLEDVSRTVQRIVLALENPEVAVCLVPDPLNDSFFVSVVLPRPLYDEDLRHDLRKLLVESYGVTYLDNRTSFLDDEVALIHFFCNCAEELDLERLQSLETEIRERATRWEDRFEAALLERFPAPRAYRLAEDYGEAFPKEYRLVTLAEDAAEDVALLERLRSGESTLELRLSMDAEEAGVCFSRLRVYRSERPYLTDLLPVLGHFGLRVIDAKLTEIALPGLGSLWSVSFRMESLAPDSAIHDELDVSVVDGLHAALSGRVEDDPLNRLVLKAGLSWQEVDVIRAYLDYARQLGAAPGRRLVAGVLARWPAATRELIALFRARFDPDLDADRPALQERARVGLARLREAIPTSDEDRVFGLLEDLIESTLRTSFFARPLDDGGELAFKLDPRRIQVMPSPRPHAEIFVHSPKLAGVHLRGGRIARGGLRWSDRRQDFRSEILGLMKTQMTKNGLIVPSGAKGGFVLKRAPRDVAEARQEADRLYAHFIEALLGLTDNIVGDEIVPPERVVRHDDDDPYLVVAADKGTGHLSDVANGVVARRGFWLGDAFASGGSDGYDHKKEGITARGAWVCVKRHFLEMGIDVEREVFSMIGIGDMAGDVFGNGLLLARRARLLAAFNHEHIFLDPDPDPETAWHERKRLFELPRSSWLDYDAKKISPGGGVFERSARAIPLTDPLRGLLDVEDESLSGEELIRAILRMRVDLLWNGGIGTYVKSFREAEGEVGDRANASVRVDARELRARVVGEGGNLGFTQLARVEYALGGGRINTDAIDNSAGVDLSDHEVCIKILLALSCASGKLDREARGELLRDCVEEVCDSVLEHNAAQARCISMDWIRSQEDPQRLMLATDFLAQHGGLDPELEFLPAREDLNLRSAGGSGAGYTRPELAVLLGYTKILAKRELVASTVPDDPSLAGLLVGYFPAALRERFHDDIHLHRLRREITATRLANAVIDRAGVTLVPELVRALGVDVADVLFTYHRVSELLGVDRLRSELEAQAVSEEVRLRAGLGIEDAIRSGTCILLALVRNARFDPESLHAWRNHVRELRDLTSPSAAGGAAASLEKDVVALAGQGIDRELAVELVRLPRLARDLAAVSLALGCEVSLVDSLEAYSAIAVETRSDWLLERVHDLSRLDVWDRIACESLYLEVLEAQHTLARRLLGCGEPAVALDELRAEKASALENIARTVQQIDLGERPSLASLAVLSQQIRRLC
ncbi:MAG: NAD-glutamate dehydrogenase domain-containing protein [Myxococcota bacterium]